MPPTRTTDDWAELDGARHDFNEFLHELRTEALRLVPASGSVFLSAGCSGRWYFDWIRDGYADPIERHIGVEAFSPRPPDLPAEAEWIDNTLDEMVDVADGSVDVVFAGQVVEHLWPEVLSGFLTEAHRVLRPGGLLVVDSPERSITEHIGWTQPEHTIELTATEARELMTLAGFVDVETTGLWLCRDPQTGRPLPLEPTGQDDSWRWRVTEADARPEDSFVWWIECRRGDAPPDETALRDRCLLLWRDVWPRVVGRVSTQGRRILSDDGDRLQVPAGPPAYPLFGPYSALAPGDWVIEVTVEIGPIRDDVADDQVVVEVDVTRGHNDEIVASTTVTAAQVRQGQASATTIPLPFHLDETAFSWQRRVLSHGVADVAVLGHLTRLRRRRPDVELVHEAPPTVVVDERSIASSSRRRRAARRCAQHAAHLGRRLRTTVRSRLGRSLSSEP